VNDGTVSGALGAINVTFAADSRYVNAFKKQGNNKPVPTPAPLPSDSGRERKRKASTSPVRAAKPNPSPSPAVDVDAELDTDTASASASTSASAPTADTGLEQLWGVTAPAVASTLPSRHLIGPASNTPASQQLQRFGFEALGYIDSCFKLKYGTPRQGAVVPTSRASLTLARTVDAASVEGLEAYSHVWVVFVFHSNTQAKYKPKISPPRLGGAKVGCLATRTPHRWNDIGLSLVKLESIETPASVAHLPAGHPRRRFIVPGGQPGCARVVLSGVDLVDGTPVLDIKPYHPSDMVPEHIVRFPQWMSEKPRAALAVCMSKQASENMTGIFMDYYKSNKQHSAFSEDQLLASASGTASDAAVDDALGAPLEFYRNRRDIEAAVLEVLSMDPRPICTKKRHADNAIYGFAFDRLNVIYRMQDPTTAAISIVELRDEKGQRNRKRELMNKQDWLEMIRTKISDE
jgi:tRNA (Thr-GGU) A37 N-methylase